MVIFIYIGKGIIGGLVVVLFTWFVAHLKFRYISFSQNKRIRKILLKYRYHGGFNLREWLLDYCDRCRNDNTFLANSKIDPLIELCNEYQGRELYNKVNKFLKLRLTNWRRHSFWGYNSQKLLHK